MIKGYYFITDENLSKAGNFSDVQNAVDAGVSVVQYRNKDAPAQEMIKEAVELKKLVYGCPTPKGVSDTSRPIFLINDNVEVALAVDADGVHLGQDDMAYDETRKLLKNKIIGVTVHNLEEAKKAEKAGADYLGVSPIFATSTKSDAGKPCGPSLISEIKKVCQIPIVAIGGINYENAKDVIDAGADAICAISAVVARDDVKEEIKKFQDLFQ